MAEHGSASKYNGGCRCDVCRRGNAERSKLYRERRLKVHVVDAPEEPRPAVPTPPPTKVGRGPKAQGQGVPATPLPKPRDLTHVACDKRIAELEAELAFLRLSLLSDLPEDPNAPRKFCKYCGRGPFTVNEQLAHMDQIHNEYNQAIEVDGVRAG
jgi:hypothetical protein